MGQPNEKLEARWRSLIAEQQASGQSVAAFCRERGLRDGPFYEWKKRLRPSEAEPFVAIEIAAVETAVTPPVALVSSRLMEIRLRHGRSLLVEPNFDPHHLRRLLAVLEQET